MAGPIPKTAATRQRTNRPKSHAQLSEAPLKRLPALPKREDGTTWHALTRRFWRDLGSSPILGQCLAVDVAALFVLAELLEVFWRTGSLTAVAELRQRQAAFGLTPLDRRRLEWEIQRVEAGAAKQNPPAPSRARVQGDPRAVLHAV